MSRGEMTEKPDPWRVPIAVLKIPDTGLHRDIEADAAIRNAVADIGGLRDVVSAQASFDVTPQSGGRYHVTGQIRARIGQTCVVTLEPMESDIDESIDVIFAPPEQIPELSALVDEAAESDQEIPDPPEPIENGIIDLLSAQAGCRVRTIGRSRRSRGSPVCRPESTEGRRKTGQLQQAQSQVIRG
jgi:hypothetical protein